MTKSELLQYWFDQVWCAGNLDVIEEMLAPDVSLSGVIVNQQFAKKDYPDLVMALRGLLGEIRITFSHTMEQGDWVAARLVLDSEHADTGDPVLVNGQLFVRFEGNLIAEVFSSFDFFSLFEQLGQLPPEALPVCMTGHRLRWC